MTSNNFIKKRNQITWVQLHHNLSSKGLANQNHRITK